MIKKTIEIIHEVGINAMIDIFTAIVLTLTVALFPGISS